MKFLSLPPGKVENLPPTKGLQLFGTVKINGDSEVMTVALHDIEGKILYSVDLPPEA